MALLARAVETKETNSLPFSCLVAEVARNPMIQMVSALQRVALVPKRDTNFIKQSVSTFVYAVIALARIGAPLPTGEPVDDAATKAWRLGGKILHIFHQRDITRGEYLLQTEDHWQLLLQLDGLDVAMRIIQDRWDDEPASAFCEWSKHQLLRLSRAALTLLLEDPVHGASAIKAHAPVSLFSKIHKWSALRSQHLQFALSMIDSYGDKSDLRLISVLLEDPVHGASAIKAARSIESR